jgi:heat shock protein 1/8
MLAEAEKYASEDAAVAERVQAKNGLESYAFSLTQTLNENGDKFAAEDKTTLETKVDDVIKQLENMDSASKEEIEGVQKELEATANPIMQRFYASSGGAPGGMPGGAPGGFPGAGAGGGADESGPSVEEVD